MEETYGGYKQAFTFGAQYWGKGGLDFGSPGRLAAVPLSPMTSPLLIVANLGSQITLARQDMLKQ